MTEGKATTLTEGKEATAKMKIHPSITPERLCEAVQRYNTTCDNPGFCLACGADVDGCEPDAREYECEVCGERQVYGAEELVLMGVGS